MSSHQILTLYEYEEAKFNNPLSRITEIALNKIKNELKNHTGRNVIEVIIDNNNRTVGVRASQFVGVIRIDKSLTIEILPKMYRNRNDEDESRYINIENLFFMLDYCGRIKIPHSNVSHLKTIRGSFFETLIYLFANDLLRCIQNSIHKEYVSEEKNLPYLRGKLLIGEHITHNSINASRFYVQNDIFTVDNRLNQIFKYVAKSLLSMSRNNKNKNLLIQILQIFDEVSDVYISKYDAEKIHLTRLNQRFYQALEISKLFLSEKSIQMSEHNFESFTFLIDMNQLFEDFIACAIKKSIKRHKEYGIKVKTQGPIKHFVEHSNNSKHGIFQMKPDISLMNLDNTVKSIIDTKYKILDSDRKRGVSQPDLYQMYAYANKYNTSDITLLYPKKPDEEIEQDDFYIDKNCKIKIRDIDLEYRLTAKKIEKKVEEFVFI